MTLQSTNHVFFQWVWKDVTPGLLEDQDNAHEQLPKPYMTLQSCIFTHT